MSAKGPKQVLHWSEQDWVSGMRHLYRWRPGVSKWVKRQMAKRRRREPSSSEPGKC